MVNISMMKLLLTNNSIHASTSESLKETVTAASSRQLTRNMIRVKSSNIWAYSMNSRDTQGDKGDVYVQFKDKYGGPGDIYVYYDVPVVVFRRWHTALSKGHYFWRFIRNIYKYAKLTGDKRGKLPNAVNYVPNNY